MSAPEPGERDPTSEALKDQVLEIVDDMKAQDVVAMFVADKTTLSDWFLLCTGTSDTHCRAIANEVQQKLKAQGLQPFKAPSGQGASWILLDYGRVIVHVLSREARERYSLEDLWSEAGKHVVRDGGEE